jgi:hypothetical protein
MSSTSSTRSTTTTGTTNLPANIWTGELYAIRSSIVTAMSYAGEDNRVSGALMVALNLVDQFAQNQSGQNQSGMIGRQNSQNNQRQQQPSRISPEAKKRIAAAQKKRWAQQRQQKTQQGHKGAKTMKAGSHS